MSIQHSFSVEAHPTPATDSKAFLSRLLREVLDQPQSVESVPSNDPSIPTPSARPPRALRPRFARPLHRATLAMATAAQARRVSASASGSASMLRVGPSPWRVGSAGFSRWSFAQSAVPELRAMWIASIAPPRSASTTGGGRAAVILQRRKTPALSSALRQG